MNKTFLTHAKIEAMVAHLANLLRAEYSQPLIKIYGVPRGGVAVAYLLAKYDRFMLADHAQDADVFVDDIIDSGATAKKWSERFPGKGFFALVDKANPHSPANGVVAQAFLSAGWLVFPWENASEEEAGAETIEDNIRRIIQFIGDDPTREGLLETPKRVAKAYSEWFDGYRIKEEDIFKVFEDGAEKVDEMVIVRDIPFVSWCEHHCAMFKGLAHIGYIPDGKIVGLSKVVRLVRMYAHRLQVQERLTNQIADSMWNNLSPKGVAVVVTAEHTCMSTRGAKVHGTDTVTSALRGAIKESAAARAEFFSLINVRK